ncbi:MAG: hypothetical protein ACR2KU_05025, partial [Gammaproteobacteria bacterium]
QIRRIAVNRDKSCHRFPSLLWLRYLPTNPRRINLRKSDRLLGKVKIAIGHGGIRTSSYHDQPIGLNGDGIGAVSASVVDVSGVCNIGEHPVVGSELGDRDAVETIPDCGEVRIVNAKRRVRRSRRHDPAVSFTLTLWRKSIS